MLKRIKNFTVALAVLVGASLGQAQKAAEIFIPIGQSPGLSGKYTSQGKITAVDARNQTISVADSGGTYSVKITKLTQIWLDRSKLKATPQKGAFADLRKDLRIEVKYVNNQRKDKGSAEWIKVQVAP